MTSLSFPKFCVHEEHGEVEVLSIGHFPDTALVRLSSGSQVEIPLVELISREDSNTALDLLLSGMVPSRG